MMQTIRLYGHLKKKFGAEHRFEVATAGEALRALNCAFPSKFIEALKRGSYKVIRGDRDKGVSLDIDLVNGFKLGNADLHIVPVATGAATSKGTVKTILGVALIGGAIFMSGGTLVAPLAGMGNTAFAGLTWGNIAVIGLGLSLAGAASLLSKPNTTKSNKDNSYSIAGPSNTAQQGDAIQLIYGECFVGSTNISFDVNIENIGAYQPEQTAVQKYVGGAFGAWGHA